LKVDRSRVAVSASQDNIATIEIDWLLPCRKTVSKFGEKPKARVYVHPRQPH
jgi:hypothetical protein